MLYIMEMGRIPVWVVGATVGGWLAAHLYMRLVWMHLSRAVLLSDGSTSSSASPPTKGAPAAKLFTT